jgi:sarcosine oxidase, subunit gamma
MNEHHPLLGSQFAIQRSPSLAIRALPDSARFNLRIDPAELERASQAFGFPLPAKIGGAVVSNGKIAICLGPDEWHLIAPSDIKENVENAFAAFYGAVPHSLVDISHREIGIEIDGADAALALSSTIAFDIEKMPVNTGCRTILDKAQIILLREAERRFRIEVWTSFATHVWGLLTSASREIELKI